MNHPGAKPTGAVHLKRGRAKPFFFGHPWVFSGSVAEVEGNPRDGDLVDLLDHKGQFIARGFYNSRSQIRVRLLCWNPEEAIDESLFRGRLAAAFDLRHALLALPAHTEAYRLVNSEGDGLPGLVVDRYGQWLVAQFLSLGMARWKEAIASTLSDLSGGLNVLERSDSDVHALEGIEPRVGPLVGDPPPPTLEVKVHGVRFIVDLWGGQKTGLFLDHRENYLAVQPYCTGRRVLDCFAYSGGFGLFAARGGAESVVAVETSQAAQELARRNAQANRLGNITWREGNVFGELRALRAEGERFGLVVLDPPKFARSAADLPKALRGYRDINLVAMQCLEEGGVLVSCSCSQHLDEATLEAMLNDAAGDVGREVQVLERRSQGRDHPVAASCPEGRYLKCFICRVL